MSNLTCSRSCLMKRDLECSVDKLSFMKENWPSFAQIENCLLYTSDAADEL